MRESPRRLARIAAPMDAGGEDAWKRVLAGVRGDWETAAQECPGRAGEPGPTRPPADRPCLEGERA